MKTKSYKMPNSYDIEVIHDGSCYITFADNITSQEVQIDNTDETQLEYTYDMYKLNVPYSPTLDNRINENFSSWLQLAIDTELNEIINSKITEVNDECQKIIYNGIDIETEYGKEHFALGTHDQQNLSAIKMIIESGIDKYPYHADGKTCVLYTASDLRNITNSAISHITYHTTYCNMLRIWIKREADPDTILNIKYGCELPEDLREYMEKLLQH